MNVSSLHVSHMGVAMLGVFLQDEAQINIARVEQQQEWVEKGARRTFAHLPNLAAAHPASAPAWELLSFCHS